jgi:TadE-like protein
MEGARQPGCFAGLYRHWYACAGSNGAQLVEFAVALPLLVVFVVGIFDFGEAFNVKQKLSDAVRTGARLGASEPTSDLPITVSDLAYPLGPASILTIRDLVDSSLLKASLNDCGLGTRTATQSTTTPWMWTFTNSCGTGAGMLTLTVERGYAVATTVGANTVKVICTRVTLTYPYKWRFNSVVTVLVPGTSYGATLPITTNAIMPNQR